MLNWETWSEDNVVDRVILTENVDMQGSYCCMLSSSDVVNNAWQKAVVANTDMTALTNFKIRAKVRKDTNSGNLYLFGRANKNNNSAYILELKDSFRFYKGTLGENFEGVPLVTSALPFSKNVTYNVELLFHTGIDNKTFVQVRCAENTDVLIWQHVFSVIISNENLTSGYFGFGCGTYHRRENYYFDYFQVYLEY